MKFILYIILLFSFRSISSQDNIILKDGSEIQSKVFEITETEISYKKHSNLDGPIYKIPIGKVFMIKYENGEKDVFRAVQNIKVNKPAEAISSVPDWASTSILFNPDINYGSFLDKRDNTVYKTVKIGTQIWLAENLKYKPHPKYGKTWIQDEEWIQDKDYLKTYGRLYSWNAARKACPRGWHLPSEQEWDQLIRHLGGSENAGRHLKEAGNVHWGNNNEADNSSGLGLMPGGLVEYLTSYTIVASGAWLNGWYWSSTSSSNEEAYWYFLYGSGNSIEKATNYKIKGVSCRCVKN